MARFYLFPLITFVSIFLTAVGSKANCVIEMNACVNHPWTYATPLFLDQDYKQGNESSQLNANRCMDRAPEYYFFCGASTPVTAIFSDGTQSQRTTYPADTSCQIEMQQCPRYPLTYNLPVFTDSDYLAGAASSLQDPNRCAARAQEYFQHCGKLSPVTTRFLRNGIVEKTTTEGTTAPASFSTTSYRHTQMGPILDVNTLQTTNTWSPGAPRMVQNAKGRFSITLLQSTRNHLFFQLLKFNEAASTWTPISGRLGPAVSDPILLTDAWNRLHVIYSASTNFCSGSYGPGNLVHMMFYEANGNWSYYEMATRDIWSGASFDCYQDPRTQRISAAVSTRENKLHLVFFDLAGTTRAGFSTFNLFDLKWRAMTSVFGTGPSQDGFGYSYVAAGPAQGEVSFIFTNFNSSGQYYRVGWLNSKDNGLNWNLVELCNSRTLGAVNCLTMDILGEVGKPTRMLFWIDPLKGGYSPLINTTIRTDRAMMYLLGSDQGGIAYPVIDSTDPSGPTPAWNQASLTYHQNALVVIGAYNGNRVGSWRSTDGGRTWSFSDVTNQFNINTQLYQIQLAKPQYGGVFDEQNLRGYWTDLLDLSQVRTFSF